jgi:hypothetical protein
MKRWNLILSLISITTFTLAESTLEGNILDSVVQQSLSFPLISLFNATDGKVAQGVVSDETGASHTSANYIQETDLRFNLSYQINQVNKKVKFMESEFGEKRF